MTGIIYGISCGSDKIYIGSTLNFKQRKHDHINKLRMGIHRNKELLSDFIKNGEEKYGIAIIETDVPREELSNREFYWMRIYGDVYNKLNLAIKKRNAYLRRYTNSAIIKLRKPVQEFMLDGTLVAEYDSVYQCHKITGIAKSNLHSHLGGRRSVNHLRGRIFKFKKT